MDERMYGEPSTSFNDEPEDAPDADAITALELLEATREHLHNALREAAFSFIAAQREEESTRGCFVGYDAVPIQENTLAPILTISQRFEDVSTAAQPEKADLNSWVLTQSKDERKPTLPSRRAAHRASSEAGIDGTPIAGDPIYYFSEHPSSALRDCQAAYRRVMQYVVEVVNAQQRAWKAAEAYASAPAEAS
ncbi:hypothetical protein ABL78_6418 [Leptomonas seymouri]|uniref:Uncharacterized protein n=1 Tax=Leptomonas seymouri TaxID=5684 RepID=A0A0N1PAD9_LEPSE|nr:hypothetical protein ABL78_6418 [Leptomonas seymouri]|eukprot:KPI84533.1 hypothetical protein ABL78_6418 [Leptomonas seymouri]